MTDREAIANLTYYRNAWIGIMYHNGDPKPWVSGVLEDAMEIGASALQERIDREKGCKNCTAGDGEFTVLLDKWGEDDFCPKCGRPLKTAMPGEE